MNKSYISNKNYTILNYRLIDIKINIFSRILSLKNIY